MTFKRGYFDFFIGSTTLDSYQPITGGVMNIMHCSHGYDRQSIHMTTIFPKQLPSNDLLATFPVNIWMATLVTLFMLVGTITIAINLYVKLDMNLVRTDLDGLHIFLRLVAGITEYDYGHWFKTFSTGNININEGFYMINSLQVDFS